MATPAISGSPRAFADPYGSLSSRLWALAWLVALALAMTYPLALHLARAIPGYAGDNLSALYDLYRFREGIVAWEGWPEALAAPPMSGALPVAGPDVLVANKALIAPLLLWGDEVLAYNGLVLLSLVLSGYGTYLLIVYLTGWPLAAAVGATAFALCPYRQHALVAGWLPLLSTQWLPFAFLYAERALREGRARYAVLAGAFAGLGALTAWPNLLAGGLPLVAYGVLRPWLGHRTVQRRGWGRRLALGAAVALLLSSPVLWALCRTAGRAPGPAAPTGIAADLMVFPGVYHPWWGARLWQGHAYPLPYPSQAPGMAYLGVAGGILAAMALLRRRDEGGSASAFFWAGALAAVLACGPVLRWGGEPVAVMLPAGGAEGLASLAAALLGVPPPSPGQGAPLPVLLPGLALHRVGNALGLPVSFHAFGAVASLAMAVLAGMGVARVSGGASEPGHRDLTGGGAGRNPGGAALIGALCTALVLIDFAMAPLVGGLTLVQEQPLDRWLAGQGEPVVIEYPLGRNTGVARYHRRYHGGASAYDALMARGLSAHEAALLEAFPHPESLAFLRLQGVTHIIVASEAYARVAGRPWGETREALDSAPGLRPAGVAREETSWRDESLTEALGTGTWLAAGPADTLYVYALQR